MVITKYIFIHEMGGSPLAMIPLEKYLIYYGINNTYQIRYSSNNLGLEDAIINVNAEIEKIATKEFDELVILAQSLGGLIAIGLEKYGWNIRKCIFIACPLKGAMIINKLDENVNETILKWFYSPVIDDLRKLTNSELFDMPDFEYNTISTSWPFTDFDGYVYRDETTMNPEFHTHIPHSDHRFIFADPRLFRKVYEIINE